MTMTPEAALALRQPFPPESVGKLPKPYRSDSPKGQCGECGGFHGLPAAHLDYVGHAAATDRLLTVDPEWNWEPFATDPNGLPLLDARGNLWIRLTICGVTRIGVGDGKSLKEIIGDAIRNAAMRFGVALDLWAKEDLVEFQQAAQEHRIGQPGLAGLRAAVAPNTADAAVSGASITVQQAANPTERYEQTQANDEAHDAEEQISPAQRSKIFALFGEAGFDTDARTTEGRTARLAYISQVLRTPVESTSDLTKVQASKVIEALLTDAASRAALEEPPAEDGAQ